MRCMTCSVDVPVAFVAAIELNVCPGCSGPIQSDESIEFMEELAGALERMPNDPKGIAGWVLSNYHLKKIGEEAPPEQFYRPLTEEQRAARQNADRQNLKIAPSPLDDFISRTDFAEAASPERQNKLKQMAQNIRSGNIDAAMYGGGGEDAAPVEEYDDGAVEAEFVNVGGVVKHAAASGGGGGGMVRQAPMTIPPESFIGSSAIANQSKDIDSMFPVPEDNKAARTIQNQRLKRVKTQQAFDTGTGFFRR